MSVVGWRLGALCDRRDLVEFTAILDCALDNARACILCWSVDLLLNIDLSGSLVFAISRCLIDQFKVLQASFLRLRYNQWTLHS